MNKIQERFVFIDGLRAIAALMVCVSHINNIVSADTILNHLKNLVHDKIGSDISPFIIFMSGVLKQVCRFGDTGMDIFFVISGFLITNILLKESQRQINIKSFYIRRFFKIVPSYACVVIVGLYLYFSNSDLSLKQEILTTGQYFLFLQNYFTQAPGLGHTWSLVVEEHFYIVYPIILWGIFKYSPREMQKFYIIGICFIIIFLVNLQRGVYHFYGTTFLYKLWPSPNIVETTTFRADALAFGCLLCVAKEYWTNKVPMALGWMFIVLALGGFMTFLHIPFTHFIYYPLDYFSAGLLMAGIYITGFRWGIENKFLVSIGRCSYNMYLWHFLFLEFLTYWITKYDLLIVIPVYFLIFIMSGVIGTKYIERPFLRLGKRIIQKRMSHELR